MKSEVIIQAVLMLAFLILGIIVYKGNTDIINAYHRENINDEEKYAKAVGTALMLTSIPCAVGVAVAFFASSEVMRFVSYCISIAGVIAFYIAFVKIQKKYNGGVH